MMGLHGVLRLWEKAKDSAFTLTQTELRLLFSSDFCQRLADDQFSARHGGTCGECVAVYVIRGSASPL